MKISNIAFKPSASPPFVHQLKISIFLPSAVGAGAAAGATSATGAGGAAQAPNNTAPTTNPFNNLDTFIAILFAPASITIARGRDGAALNKNLAMFGALLYVYGVAFALGMWIGGTAK